MSLLGNYIQKKLFDFYNNNKMNIEMEIKQTYLRTQILEKQYDAQKFIQFLNEQLNIGDDLELCTFQDLKKVVQAFIAQENEKFKEQKWNQQPLMKNQSGLRRESLASELSEKVMASSTIIAKQKTILFDKYNFAEPEFSKTFRCIKTNDKYPNKPLHCQVCNPQRKTTGGFFGLGATSFLEFQVFTIETGWKVGRRYSDFQWLRTFLRKFYPTQIVPPIPEKKASKRTQKHVQKRMRILQYFLNDIMSIPQFKNNKYVQGFLRITEPSKLVQLKEDSERIKISGNINEVQTDSGDINIRLNTENRAYLQQMKKFIPQIQKMYKEITRKGKALQVIQLDEVTALYQMGNLFAEIHQKSKDVLNRVPNAKGLKNLNQIYVTLNNMTIQWGNLIKSQHQIIEKNFNTFFKYIRNDLHGYLEIFQLQQQYEDQFAKGKISLDKRKQRIYSLFDMSKWQISKEIAVALPKQILHNKAQAFKVMLPRQNTELDKLRLKDCLYISQLFKNGDENFNRSSLKFKQNFRQWSIKIKVNTQQISELWSEMAISFAGEGKTQKLKEKPIIQNIGNQIMDD